ncbi:hypothetical protein [uncultured Bradyrhizobium sp.]|uniref:hypothetical protein n=1 Tax=uncultured Bradyrhizobium sp. TaxID=199684 RepID=UPI0035C9CE3A
MTIPPNDLPKSSWRGALAGWVKDAASRFVNDGELEGLDRTEFAQIASDLNLSPAELHAISIGSNRSAGLLNKRMAEFGLSPKALHERHPEVLRDLQRVCGMCSSKKRCTRETAQRGPDPRKSNDCPNSQTLQALAAKRIIDDRALPIGPACC